MRELVSEILALLTALGLSVPDDAAGRVPSLLEYAGRDRLASVRIADAALSGTAAPAAPTVEVSLLFDDINPREADERAVADAAELVDALVDPTQITKAVLVPPGQTDGAVLVVARLEVLQLRTPGGDLHDDIEHEDAARAVLEALSRGTTNADRLDVSRAATPLDIDGERTLWTFEVRCDIDHHAQQTWASARAELEQRLADEAGLLFEAAGPGYAPAELHIDRAARLTVISVAGGELSRPAPGVALLELSLTCYHERTS